MDGLIPLLRLLADGNTRSGAELGRTLGISRAAVWKRIQRLQQLGLRVESETGRGYRLAHPIDLLDPQRLPTLLSTPSRTALHGIEILPSVDSTNAHLRRRAPWPGPVACLAEHQHAGRGRRGRQWISPFAASLYLSLAWPFPDRPPALETLGLRTALATAQALEGLGLEGIQLKWPNDLQLEGRKLAGILIELQGEWGGPQAAIIGIGINVRLPEATAHALDRPWTDLHRAMGPACPDRTRLAGAVLDRLVSLLQALQRGESEDWHTQWTARDPYQGRPVRLLCEGGEIHGIHRGIATDGALLVEHHGICRPYYSGEISLRPLEKSP